MRKIEKPETLFKFLEGYRNTYWADDAVELFKEWLEKQLRFHVHENKDTQVIHYLMGQLDD